MNPRPEDKTATRQRSEAHGGVAYEDLDFFAVEFTDGVGIVTLDRPADTNMFRAGDHRQFAELMRRLDGDERVRAVVFTGGPRILSGGASPEFMQALATDEAVRAETIESSRRLIRAHIDFTKPVIAAIAGVGLGTGLSFALMCDVVVAEETARLAAAQVRVGLVPGDGAALIWPLAVGLTRAKRYLLTGDWLSGPEAERLGLVSEVVPHGTSLDRAVELAVRFTRGPDRALRLTKQALNEWLRVHQMLYELSLALEAGVFGAEEARWALEGLRAGRFGEMGTSEGIQWE